MRPTRAHRQLSAVEIYASIDSARSPAFSRQDICGRRAGKGVVLPRRARVSNAGERGRAHFAARLLADKFEGSGREKLLPESRFKLRKDPANLLGVSSLLRSYGLNM